MREPHLQAVLFDMDGTIVDTEPLWIEAEFDLVEEFGGQWSIDHAHNLVGNDLRVSAAYIRKHGGVDLPDQELINRLQSHVISRAKKNPPWRPGALELMADLRHQNIPLALVTMSWSDLALTIADLTPDNTFATIVSGDQVTNGKPHPEPYQLALERLSVDASHAVAIEDSATGTRSAMAAGVATLVVPHVIDVPDKLGTARVNDLSSVTTADLKALLL